MDLRLKFVINSFKELEHRYGSLILIDDLVHKTKMPEEEIRTILNDMKQKRVIFETKPNCFVRRDRLV